ncbi:hypothetical protein Poli38472_003519 [Pythium oligandrum]|uniref:Cyclin-dependent kinase 2 homolog n=1 Tax=Pythium oligandrum TaxID=41045 RepID=A0A8K1C6N9_PYTOL|nr:hypothetical protein Poli38472_003519 [Pythium oligandrum]|eukprot:TMW57594.1 hypothetical protein Poli38472_003519 [Pythium oligandrum]
MENYESLGTIGEGTYGVVLKCRHRVTGQIVAIKKFKESDDDEQVKKTALREIKVLKQLRHENIVSLLEVFRVKGKLYLVFEYVEKTILEEIEKNPEGLDPAHIKRLMWQLVRAIHFCHQHNIIHRDIKPENLLVSRNGVLKLCDFGFARPLAGAGAKYTEYVSTRWYRAPELLVGDVSYGKAVDVWSIGCMFAEISTGLPLFPGDSDIDQLYHIIRCLGRITPRQQELFKKNSLYIGVKLPQSSEKEPLDARFTHFDKHAMDLLKQTIKEEPLDRWTCSELLNHPFFDNAGDVYEQELQDAIQRDLNDTMALRKKRMRTQKRPPSRGGASGGAVANLPSPTSLEGYSNASYKSAQSVPKEKNVNLSTINHGGANKKQQIGAPANGTVVLPTLSSMTPSSSSTSTVSTSSGSHAEPNPSQQSSPIQGQPHPWPTKKHGHNTVLPIPTEHMDLIQQHQTQQRVSMTSHGGRSQYQTQPFSPFQSFVPPPKPPPTSYTKNPYSGASTPTSKQSRVFPLSNNPSGNAKQSTPSTPMTPPPSTTVANVVSHSLQSSMEIYSPKKGASNSSSNSKKSYVPQVLPSGFGTSGEPSPAQVHAYAPPKTSHQSLRGGKHHARRDGDHRNY